MNQPAPRLATYQDLFDLPDYVIGEILNGQLITQPRPAPRHARSASIIGGEIMAPYDQGRSGPGGWWILDEPELHLGANILVPDLAGWRRERMPYFPDEAYFSIAPDWICEVLSPGTARTDRAVKMPIYAGESVQWLWLVDPDVRILEVYHWFEGQWLLEHTWQNNEVAKAPPFDAISMNMSDFWAPQAIVTTTIS
ncbi:MAG: Uma2 family endonuclease [Methylococcales bacterium]